MTRILLQTVVTRNPSVLMHEIQNELICMDEKSGYYIGINRTGKHIWNLLEKPMSVQSIIDSLKTRYPDQSTIDEDVFDYLNTLLELNNGDGLICIV